MNDFSGEREAYEVPVELDIQFGDITRTFTDEDTTLMLFTEDRFNHCVYRIANGIYATQGDIRRTCQAGIFEEQPDTATMEHYYKVQTHILMMSYSKSINFQK